MEHRELAAFARGEGFDSVEAYVEAHAAELPLAWKVVFEKLRRLDGVSPDSP